MAESVRRRHTHRGLPTGRHGVRWTPRPLQSPCPTRGTVSGSLILVRAICGGRHTMLNAVNTVGTEHDGTQRDAPNHHGWIFVSTRLKQCRGLRHDRRGPVVPATGTATFPPVTTPDLTQRDRSPVRRPHRTGHDWLNHVPHPFTVTGLIARRLPLGLAPMAPCPHRLAWLPAVPPQAMAWAVSRRTVEDFRVRDARPIRDRLLRRIPRGSCRVPGSVHRRRAMCSVR